MSSFRKRIRWRLWCAVVISTVLIGAGPVDRLERLTEKKPAAAVKRGESWLEKNQDHEDYVMVRGIVARAAFAVAEQADTVDGWQHFQRDYAYALSLRQPAAVLEEAAAWRDANAVSSTVALWRAFQENYP